MRTRALAVVAVVLLAGCSGFTGGDGTPTPTMTPAPVPTPEPVEGTSTPTAEDLADIPERHALALSGQSYTITETLRIGPAGNATFRERTRVAVVPDRPAVAVDYDRTDVSETDGIRRLAVWWSGDRSYYRYSVAGEPDARYVPGPYHDEPPVGGFLRTAGSVPAVFENLSVGSVTQEDGSTVLAGSITDPSTVPRLDRFTRIDNETMTAAVGQNGTVRSVAIGYDATVANRDEKRVRYTFGVSDVGATTVEVPAWMDRFDRPDR